MQQIKNWLNKPYYLNKDDYFNLKISLGFGLAVFIFLVVFQPIDVSLLSIMNEYVFKLIFGVITSLVMLFYFFVVVKLFPKYYNNETWTIGKHLINIIGVLIFCGIINIFFTKNAIKPEFFKKNISPLKILTRSVLYGIIPSLTYVYYDEKQRLKKAENIARKINAKKTTLTKTKKISYNKKITIFSDNKKNAISFKINQLVYITSETNYACFFIKEKNEGLKEQIIRLSLKKVEKKLSAFNNIVRCHKSFIINTNYIKSISGNPRRYYFHLAGLEKEIPVSGKFSQEELEKLIYL